ncbi:MAG: type I-U CRISPR-associated protein Csx17, partial [Opitutales bacterium]
MNSQNIPRNEIPLPGCTPEPLMGYLKALGVFRIISEQADNSCRAAWRGGKLNLRTTLSEEELVEFFYNDYTPTPVVVPWSGSDFFDVKPTKQQQDESKHKNTPTGSTIIEAFIENKSPRLENYRETLKACVQAMEQVGISKKEQMKGDAKARFLAFLRTLPYLHLDDWIDAASALPGEDLKLNTLLGSGGGSDGNTHFSDNFMQNLWDSLPDFDGQKAVSNADVLKLQATESIERLKAGLFDYTTSALVKKRTSSLYHSGAVGGPNAGQGFERSSFGNPWDFILAIEGCVMFAGAVSRKLGASKNHAVFPFQTRACATDSDSLGEKENAGQEIWLPLWHRFCGIGEIKSLFSEGRAEWHGKQSERGVDFAKAIASLGIDRGIDSFARYGILKGRVGGDNYNTAALLGRFEVEAQPNIDLLREADPWINRYHRACGDKTPARFGTALRRLDTAVFDYCRFGGLERFQAILLALGQAEREAAHGPKFRESGWLPPLPRLSPDWVSAADDGSDEFAIAAALAGIQGAGGYPGIRANLEPVEFRKGRLDWKDDTAVVVWKRGSLADNLCAVLERRLLDWKRLNLPYVPIVSSRTVSPATIARFISGELDDTRIEQLLRGLMCCKIKRQPDNGSLQEVPRFFAMLKLCFPGFYSDGRRPAQVSAEFWENANQIKPEARIIQLVRAGRLDEALLSATQRLRNSGLTPAPIQWETQSCGVDTTRLAAALLLPVKPRSLEHLWNLVRRYKRTEPALES